MKRTNILLLATTLGSMGPAGMASATPLTVGAPYLLLRDVAENDIGIATGERIEFGDTSVVPNGNNGTTASAQTTNLSTGAPITEALPFVGSTAVPNQFDRSIAYNANLLGPRTLTFTNAVGSAGAPDTATVTTGSLVGVTPPPFASNVTISGSSANPAFAWTYPTGSVNGVIINIFDKSLMNAAGGADIVYATTKPGTTKSFTVPTALAGGLSLQLNHNYTIDIYGVVSRNPSGSINNANSAAWSEAFFDFTPLTAGAPVVNLPTITSTGAYQYSMTVVAGQTYFVDPTVAVGYSFTTGADDPNFASVLLPAVQTAPIRRVVSLRRERAQRHGLAGIRVRLSERWCRRVQGHRHRPCGRARPADTTAFITGLTFVGDGSFTGTQTPITERVAAVPEPGSIALLASGLLAWPLFRRHRAHRLTG